MELDVLYCWLPCVLCCAGGCPVCYAMLVAAQCAMLCYAVLVAAQRAMLVAA